MTLTFDLLTLKVVSESRVTILVFLGLSVLDLGPMYAKDQDRQTDVRQHHSLMPRLTNVRIENRLSRQDAVQWLQQYVNNASVDRVLVQCALASTTVWWGRESYILAYSI